MPRVLLRDELRVPTKQPADVGGRPSPYRDEFEQIVFSMALLGATDKAIGDHFGVDVLTVRRWRTDHPGFCNAYTEGRTVADARVAHSLYRMATGYIGPDGKYYPPQAGAAAQWLSIRQRKLWSKVAEDNAPIAVNVSTVGMTAIEATAVYMRIIQGVGDQSRTIDAEPEPEQDAPLIGPRRATRH